MNTGEQRYRELQAQARNTGRSTQELLILYVLEGFLSRVAASSHRRSLILKGGVLLAALDARRPTRDIDFAGVDLNNEVDHVLKLCVEVASENQDDGIIFDGATASAATIRDDDEYNGVRVSMPASIHTAQIRFHIDINVGDPILPEPDEVKVPRMLDNANHILLLGYPISMVLAEKIVTAIQRGTASTRWRDFGDIYELSRRHSVSLNDLKTSVHTVAQHRVVELIALEEALSVLSKLVTQSTKTGDSNKIYSNYRRSLRTCYKRSTYSVIQLLMVGQKTIRFGIPSLSFGDKRPSTRKQVSRQPSSIGYDDVIVSFIPLGSARAISLYPQLISMSDW